MSFISPSKHQKFCSKLKEEIDMLVNYSAVNNLPFEQLIAIEQDRQSLITIASQYQKRLKELRDLIERYSQIEKRARASLRREKSKFRKIYPKSSGITLSPINDPSKTSYL